MKRILASLAIAGLMYTGAYAFAGDDVSQAGMAQQNKMMKDCLAKHASADKKMTKDDIEKACREETKSQKDSPSKMSSTTQEQNIGTTLAANSIGRSAAKLNLW